METVTFKPRKSAGIFVLMIGLPAFLVVQSVIDQRLVGGIISSLLLILMTMVWFSFSYEITKEALIIKMLFGNTSISLASITGYKHANGIMAASSLSTIRLEVFYNKYDSAIVSPRDQEEFIRTLIQRCPNINCNITQSP